MRQGKQEIQHEVPLRYRISDRRAFGGLVAGARLAAFTYRRLCGDRVGWLFPGAHGRQVWQGTASAAYIQRRLQVCEQMCGFQVDSCSKRTPGHESSCGAVSGRVSDEACMGRLPLVMERTNKPCLYGRKLRAL